jgi:hypothetical protein
MPIRPCPKCGGTERYDCDTCKACALPGACRLTDAGTSLTFRIGNSRKGEITCRVSATPRCPPLIARASDEVAGRSIHLGIDARPCAATVG